MPERSRRLDLRLYLMCEPLSVALLTGLAVLFFLAVTGLSRIYIAKQGALATRWSSRGLADIQAHRYNFAVNDFRTALLYSRDNYWYKLSLAEALLGEKRTDEAYAYLINLWDRQPENGLVNLDLARIAAGRGQTEKALRYYHNAIYAPWPGDQEKERRNTRLELIGLLLHIGAGTQAQSELIALEANLGDQPSQQAYIGGLFLKVQDYARALAAFRLSLKSDSHDPVALAGAGDAAFKLARYSLAERYLAQAVEVVPGDTQSAALLRITRLVLEMDPFRQSISPARRSQIAFDAYAVAGDRLKACNTPGGSGANAALLQALQLDWATLKPHITEGSLRRNPNLVNKALNMVFSIERQTAGACGVPTNSDSALLLIAKLHEEN